MTASPSDAAGLAYRLALPDAWVRLPTNPLEMRTAARRYLERRYGDLPRDSTLAVRRRLEEHLVQLADQAADRHGLDLLLLDLQVEQQTLTATCLVSLTPLPVGDPGALQVLAEACAPEAISSEVVALGTHLVCRVVRDGEQAAQESSTPEQDRATVSAVLDQARRLGAPGVPDALEPDQVRAYARPRLVEYYLPSPEEGPGLLLSFSMQAVPLYGLLTELFDAMVASVQWSQDGTTWR